jgi:hypothetical protein
MAVSAPGGVKQKASRAHASCASAEIGLHRLVASQEPQALGRRLGVLRDRWAMARGHRWSHVGGGKTDVLSEMLISRCVRARERNEQVIILCCGCWGVVFAAGSNSF